MFCSAQGREYRPSLRCNKQHRGMKSTADKHIVRDVGVLLSPRILDKYERVVERVYRSFFHNSSYISLV